MRGGYFRRENDQKIGIYNLDILPIVYLFLRLWKKYFDLLKRYRSRFFIIVPSKRGKVKCSIFGSLEELLSKGKHQKLKSMTVVNRIVIQIEQKPEIVFQKESLEKAALVKHNSFKIIFYFSRFIHLLAFIRCRECRKKFYHTVSKAYFQKG